MKNSMAWKALFLLLVATLPYCCLAQTEELQKDCKDDPDLLLDKKGTPTLFPAKDLRSKLVRHQTPEFPKACRCSGNVQVLARINTDGKIDCHQFLIGHPLLRSNIAQALQAWRFQPFKAQGKVVSVLTVITFTIGTDFRVSDNITEPQTLPCASNEKLLKDEKGKLVWLSSQQLREMAVHKPEPTEDTHLKIGGTVFVDILVNGDGKVICAKVANGHPILRGHAMNAATQWKFKPVIKNGKPIAFAGRLMFFISSR